MLSCPFLWDVGGSAEAFVEAMSQFKFCLCSVLLPSLPTGAGFLTDSPSQSLFSGESDLHQPPRPFFLAFSCSDYFGEHSRLYFILKKSAMALAGAG